MAEKRAILKLKSADVVPPEEDHRVELATYDMLLPCRRYEVGYKVSVLGQVSPTLEFLLMASSDEYRKVIQQKVTRLAAKARACGIHVIMITQRAAQEAIPPGIRDNLNNRLVLKVAGEAGSVLALGVKGAERLLGKGHLAARLGGDKPAGEEYFVAQVPFATTEELNAFAEAVLRQ